MNIFKVVFMGSFIDLEILEPLDSGLVSLVASTSLIGSITDSPVCRLLDVLLALL